MHKIVLDTPYFHMSAVALVHAVARCSEEGGGLSGGNPVRHTPPHVDNRSIQPKVQAIQQRTRPEHVMRRRSRGWGWGVRGSSGCIVLLIVEAGGG